MTLHILWKAKGLRYKKGPRVRTIPRPPEYTEDTRDKWENDLGFRMSRHTNRAPFWDHEKR